MSKYINKNVNSLSKYYLKTIHRIYNWKDIINPTQKCFSRVKPQRSTSRNSIEKFYISTPPSTTPTSSSELLDSDKIVSFMLIKMEKSSSNTSSPSPWILQVWSLIENSFYSKPEASGTSALKEHNNMKPESWSCISKPINSEEHLTTSSTNKLTNHTSSPSPIPSTFASKKLADTTITDLS